MVGVPHGPGLWLCHLRTQNPERGTPGLWPEGLDNRRLHNARCREESSGGGGGEHMTCVVVSGTAGSRRRTQYCQPRHLPGQPAISWPRPTVWRTQNLVLRCPAAANSERRTPAFGRHIDAINRARVEYLQSSAPRGDCYPRATGSTHPDAVRGAEWKRFDARVQSRAQFCTSRSHLCRSLRPLGCVDTQLSHRSSTSCQ